VNLPRQIWSVLDGRQRRGMVYLLALSLFTGLATLGGVAAVVPFFSLLADPELLQHSARLTAVAHALNIETRDGVLLMLGVGFIAVMLVTSLINLLGMIAFDRFTQAVSTDLQIVLFREYARRNFLFHATHNQAALASNVINEVMRFTMGILHNILLLCSSAIAATLISLAVIVVNPVVAGAATLVLGGTYWLIYVLSRRRLNADGATVARLWDERARTVALTFGAIKELLLYGAQGVFVGKFASQSRSIGRSMTNNNIVAQTPKYVLEFITAAGLIGTALFLNRTSHSGAWLAELTFLCLAAYRLLPALHQIFAALARIRAHRAAFEKIADDLIRGRAAGAVRAPDAPPAWRGRPRSSIELVDVSFRYSRDRAAAVEHVSLSFGAGATIGFVGPNGSGKTTLADLMLGVLVPDSGRILVDGVALDDDNRAAWQANVAYVPQSVYLLDATVTENIALGLPGAEIDTGKVLAAARAAQLEEVILGLPRGFDERLGEHGAFLSGGQRQRIAIARALYRDATFLVFDEATSALDGLTEAEVMSALNGLRGSRTIVHIAHRLTSLRNCDVIVDFDLGRVAARGKSLVLEAANAAR
jgi:ABC-type multidrug transport system fused ATPase/permease subunit